MMTRAWLSTVETTVTPYGYVQPPTLCYPYSTMLSLFRDLSIACSVVEEEALLSLSNRALSGVTSTLLSTPRATTRYNATCVVSMGCPVHVRAMRVESSDYEHVLIVVSIQTGIAKGTQSPDVRVAVRVVLN